MDVTDWQHFGAKFLLMYSEASFTAIWFEACVYLPLYSEIDLAVGNINTVTRIVLCAFMEAKVYLSVYESLPLIVFAGTKMLCVPVVT